MQLQRWCSNTANCSRCVAHGSVATLFVKRPLNRGFVDSNLSEVKNASTQPWIEDYAKNLLKPKYEWAWKVFVYKSVESWNQQQNFEA